MWGTHVYCQTKCHCAPRSIRTQCQEREHKFEYNCECECECECACECECECELECKYILNYKYICLTVANRVIARPARVASCIPIDFLDAGDLLRNRNRNGNLFRCRFRISNLYSKSQSNFPASRAGILNPNQKFNCSRLFYYLFWYSLTKQRALSLSLAHSGALSRSQVLKRHVDRHRARFEAEFETILRYYRAFSSLISRQSGSRPTL